MYKLVVVGLACSVFGGAIGAFATGAVDSQASAPRATTVTVNSPTCVKGYETAGKALTIAGHALQDAAGYIPLIEAAAKAGLDQNVSGIRAVAARETAINEKIGLLGGQMMKLNNSFHPAPGGCS